MSYEHYNAQFIQEHNILFNTLTNKIQRKIIVYNREIVKKKNVSIKKINNISDF